MRWIVLMVAVSLLLPSGGFGQHTGLGLSIQETAIDNDSFVELESIGSSDRFRVLCLTNATDCCTSDLTPAGMDGTGDWFFPNGMPLLPFITESGSRRNGFTRERGQSVVGLIRFNDASERGRFRCDLLGDSIYFNLLDFRTISNTSSASTVTAGQPVTLQCSVFFVTNPLPDNSATPEFEWFFGSQPLTPTTNTNSGRTYTSIYSITSTRVSDEGMYTCRLRGNQLTARNTMVTIRPATLTPSITASGTNTAGETYSLACSVTVAGLTNPPTPTFTWSGPMNNPAPSGMVSADGRMSTLIFEPLSAPSHAGTYTCRAEIASLGGDDANTFEVQVNVPVITAVVTPSSSSSLTLGQTGFSLACDVSGTDNLNAPTLTYEWRRNGGVVPNQQERTLSLSPLSDSQVGMHICSVTVDSTLLSSMVMRTSGTHTVSAQISSPSSVSVSSDPGFFGTAGTNVTIICRVELGPTVTDPSQITVDARLIHDGTTELETTGPTREGTTFIFAAIVSSFQAANDGNYVCTANVTSQSQYVTGFATATGVMEIGIGFTTPPPSESSGNTAGIAVGVVLVIVAAVVAVVTALIIVFFVRRRNRLVKNYKATYVPPPVSYTKIDDADGGAGAGLRRSNTPKVEEFPSDTAVTEGEGVYFKITVSGVPQPTVTWYHDGEPVKADYAREIEADGSLAIPSTELKHSGVYKAVVANQHGSEEREVKLIVNDEGGAITSPLAAASDGKVYTKPVPLTDFGKYVADLHATSNQPFKDLYQALDTGEDGHTTSYAVSGGRKPLNRFGNIVVYDDNRIPLQPIPDVQGCQSDYVNACYVDGYTLQNKFIATQGPLPKTVADFWRLIWQERPPTIVMITNIKEGNRIKCQQYWPDSGKKDFGPFQVTITDQQENADYVIRTLSVSLSGSGRSHKVTQYHFTAWPDHGVPDYATPILAFHRRVKSQHHPSRGPMVVHCSAGVGRTGTFIVLDHILEQIEKEQVVDIPGAITKIRQKRMKMVQTHDQFMFIHDAILESVTCGDTQISTTDLRISVAKMKKRDNHNQPKGFNYQFKILEQVSPNPEEVLSTTALSYPDKNRNDSYLPADRWRVVLKGEQPDYIHAVSINGYKHKRAFIIAQGPMESTVRNFWKMIYDRKCAVVVMVSGLVEEGQEASAQYWPDTGMGQFGEFIVDKLGEEALEGFTIRNLSIMDKRTQKAHQVTQFHITCWSPDGRCSNLKSITDVIEEVTKVQIRSGNKPIVVHCNDTVTRSGMFCAIATTIERCKTEGVVDVFQVVKALRVQKPGAVPNVPHYKQVFEAVLVYLESFDTYANFS